MIKNEEIIDFILDNKNKWLNCRINGVKKLFINSNHLYLLKIESFKVFSNYLLISNLGIKLKKETRFNCRYCLQFEESYILNYYNQKEEDTIILQEEKQDGETIFLSEEKISKIIDYINANDINYSIQNPNDKFADDVCLLDEIKSLSKINTLLTNLEYIMNKYNLKWVHKNLMLEIAKQGVKDVLPCTANC